LPGRSSRKLWPRHELFRENIDLYQILYRALIETDPSPFREGKPGHFTEEQRMLHTLNFFLRNLVFSFIKYFDDSTADEDQANVYMEREWRVLGDINFTLADVYRVFMPERYAKRFREDLPTYTGQLTFSNSI
jgi:hypothetical protein